MPQLRVLEHGWKPLLRPHYPHFLAEDNAVWTAYLKKEAHRIEELWYDLRVGQPVQLQPDASDMERRIALGLTRKRIDVVCLVDGDFWVVEVKPYASMLAVGQALTYARLFALEYELTGRIIPVIVCNVIDEDLIEEFDEFGILVMAIEPVV